MSFIGFVFPPCVAYCQALGADGKVTKSLLEDRFSEKECLHLQFGLNIEHLQTV